MGKTIACLLLLSLLLTGCATVTASLSTAQPPRPSLPVAGATETAAPPSVTLSRGYGDCKDKVTLLASLLQAPDLAAQVLAAVAPVLWSESDVHKHPLAQRKASYVGTVYRDGRSANVPSDARY